MKRKYKEIFKLKKMLEDADIPFYWRETSLDLMEHYQICYPVLDDSQRWISVIEGFGTYGAEQDKLEIMGGLTPWERFIYYGEDCPVIGYLTAHNVFNRIKNDWEERNYGR